MLIASPAPLTRLYDLSQDRAEAKNLATAEPARVRALEAEWNRIAAECRTLAGDADAGELQQPGAMRRFLFDQSGQQLRCLRERTLREQRLCAGEQVSLANLKGKVVLIDFWATRCGPCRRVMPDLVETYKQYHPAGFEIVGISLDSDKDRLTKFLADKKMTWAQYFDGKGWQTKLAGTYGVNSIPATYLLDGEGKIIGKDLRGEALEKAVAEALKK